MELTIENWDVCVAQMEGMRKKVSELADEYKRLADEAERFRRATEKPE